MSIINVDAMGKACPIPVIETRKALEQVKEPCTVQVHVDNTAAEQNILRLATGLGIDARSVKTEHKHYVVSLNVRRPIYPDAPETDCLNCQEKTVIAIGSSIMGEGSEELGTILLKGYLYAVAHHEKLPTAIVFYNGGAVLTTEGSAVLEDLKAMEQAGVEILTCGTCLDYYKLKEKLAVGKVTNMYHIVELMNAADKVLKP